MHNVHRANSFLALFLFAAWAIAAPTLTPSPPSIKAAAHLVQDFQSGAVLAESNAETRMEPASLTKMMTAYVVFSELRDGNVALGDEVLISEKAWRMPGSRSFVEVDKRVPLDVLLKGVIIQSGNDASVALAEHVAGDESAFAQLMNQHATSLGLADTNFVNATGLPDADHYTTAKDMAKLGAALIRDFPEHYQWHAIREFEYNNIKQYNRNSLLWRDKTVDGIKTGHTESAGFCLVASAERDEMRLISVVMGSQSEKARARESQTLLNYGFRFFETHRLYSAKEPVTTVQVWKGARDSLTMGLGEDLYVTVPRGQYGKLSASMDIDSRIVAPVVEGEVRGTVNVRLGETIAIERPLVALQSVAEGSLWQRLMDHVELYFR